MNRRKMLLLARQPTYAQRIRALFGSSIVAYWPLGEQSGTVAVDVINERNGAYAASGVTLGQSGLGGRTSAYMDGTAGFVNIYSAALNAATNMKEFSMIVFAKGDSGIWAALTTRFIGQLRSDSQNFAYIIHNGSAVNRLDFRYVAANTDKIITVADHNPADWMMYTVTVSKTGEAFRAYINDIEVKGSPSTTLGDYTGALASTNCLLGASSTVPGAPWKGNLQYGLVYNGVLTQAQIRTIWRSLRLGYKTLTVLGDSVSSTAIGWQGIVPVTYNGGKVTLATRAVSGQNIITNMDAQVVASANDDADKIIIALGTNDDNAGNMTALQAEAEENIVELKASNPRATLYWMNVLPRWTDATTGPEVAKGNIRTAIAAACTAQGITCWDTYTTPWITQAQTSDGLHPTAAGHAAIATQVLARL